MKKVLMFVVLTGVFLLITAYAQWGETTWSVSNDGLFPKIKLGDETIVIPPQPGFVAKKPLQHRFAAIINQQMRGFTPFTLTYITTDANINSRLLTGSLQSLVQYNRYMVLGTDRTIPYTSYISTAAFEECKVTTKRMLATPEMIKTMSRFGEDTTKENFGISPKINMALTPTVIVDEENLLIFLTGIVVETPSGSYSVLCATAIIHVKGRLLNLWAYATCNSPNEIEKVGEWVFLQARRTANSILNANILE